MTLRPLWYNLPGPDKLPRDSERAIAGAALVKTGTPSVFGMNELVGPGKNSMTNTGSAFAKKVNAALGAAYTMVVPTTAFNENYLFYEKKTTQLVEKLPDKILAATIGGKAVPGRHLTLAVFKDVTSGQKFVFGNTHLVDGPAVGSRTGSAGADRDGRAATGLRAAWRLPDPGRRGHEPFGRPQGVHQRRTRQHAQGRQVRHAGHRPRDLHQHQEGHGKQERRLDHRSRLLLEADDVNAYTVALGYDASGTFPALRPSDHVPILFSVSSGA